MKITAVVTADNIFIKGTVFTKILVRIIILQKTWLRRFKKRLESRIGDRLLVSQVTCPPLDSSPDSLWPIQTMELDWSKYRVDFKNSISYNKS